MYSVAFSADGAQLVSGSRDGTARIWDVATGAKLSQHRFIREVRTARLSPDGSHLLAATWGGTTYLRDVATDENVLELRLSSGYVNNAADFTPDGTSLLTSLGPNQGNPAPAVWSVPDPASSDPASDRLRPRPSYQAKWERQVQVIAQAFSADGQAFATAQADGNGAIWSMADGSLLTKLRGHAGLVSTVAFSPNGKRVATGSSDGTVRFWDPQTGQALGALITFSEDHWATVDPEGRYDASHQDVDSLAWVINGEPYKLNQLRDLYYSPGLAEFLINGRDTAPSRGALSRRGPSPPRVVVDGPGEGSPIVRVTVQDTGGGVGEVFVALNGSDISVAVSEACPKMG